MGTFKAINQQTALLEVAKSTDEFAEYWKAAYVYPPFSHKENGQITNVAFSPDVNLPSCAVTCGTRVHIYGEPPDWNRVKALTVFPQPVYGGHYREDGRLFVCACEDGIVRAFDMSTGVVLRQFLGHKMAVHSCAFSKDGLKIGSAGDDRTIRIWDLSVGKELTCYSEHSDYARRIIPIATDSSLWISASYDKTVKFYDSRLERSVRTIECPSLVEDIALSPNGLSLAVASDRAIYMWDAVTPSAKPTAILQHHHKTVTSLCYAAKGSYLLSGSLDKHIKVFDMDPISNFSVVTTLDQPCPITKLAIHGFDDKFMAVVTSDNKVSLSTRKQDAVKPEVLTIGRLKASRYFERVLNNVPVAPIGGFRSGYETGEIENKVSVVNTKQDQRGFPGAQTGPVRYYDKMLRKFEHSKALTNVMKDAFLKKNVEAAIAVIDELMRRDVLRSALAGRPELWVAKALRFAGQQYHHSSYQRVLSEFVGAIVDVYGDALLGSNDQELRKAFRYVCEVVDTEWDLKLEANELVGAVECLLNQSQPFIE